MATSTEYIKYVCDQIEGIGIIRYRKMFGEYMVYINEKPILLVCNDTVFIKIKEEIKDLMNNAEKSFPYNGAKEHYILDIEDRNLCYSVLNILETITPLPKKKK